MEFKVSIENSGLYTYLKAESIPHMTYELARHLKMIGLEGLAGRTIRIECDSKELAQPARREG